MDIRNKVISIPAAACDELANEYFMGISGIDRPGPKYHRMKKEAFDIRDRIRPNVQIRAVYSYYDKVELSGSTAVIDQVTFHCNAFEQIDPGAVHGVFLHLLTAGEFYLDGEPIMNQLFADIWGTAFTDAGRMKLEEMFRQGGRVSQGFGPGFYGMESIQMKDLTKLLDGGAIGIETKATGVLVPLKSCGGMTFRVGEGYVNIESECINCLGNPSGCAFCNMGRKQHNDEKK